MVSDFDCITGPIKARIHGVYTVKIRARLTFSNGIQMSNRVQTNLINLVTAVPRILKLRHGHKPCER